MLFRHAEEAFRILSRCSGGYQSYQSWPIATSFVCNVGACAERSFRRAGGRKGARERAESQALVILSIQSRPSISTERDESLKRPCRCSFDPAAGTLIAASLSDFNPR